MSEVRPIEIVGGGLAGLSLGLALQRSGVPTTVFEAGTYPRHRVCGEFIAGLKTGTIDTLGLAPLLADARPLRQVTWFSRGHLMRRQELAQPALALSRYALDARLAAAFAQAGGTLATGHRIDDHTTPEGRVFAHGRCRAESPWVGLKVHARGLALRSELEFHLGKNAYAGLSGVENGFVNVCGLFRRQPGLPVTKASALIEYLRAAELVSIADRLSRADLDPESFSAVAGFTFTRPGPISGRISLGDQFAMIPPYTGNGMAIAFQTAECALRPLQAWARGTATWAETTRVTMKSIQRRLDHRLFIAGQLHGFMLSPLAQKVFAVASQTRLLPFRRLAAAIHA